MVIKLSKYTLELYELIDEGVTIFDFEYDFYTDDIEIKKAWEQKFIDKYLFYEIGFGTVFRFKHFLKQKLNSVAPYYKQLYETELKSKNVNFLFNKDLKEEFIREVISAKETTDNSSNNIAKETSDNASNNISKETSDNSINNMTVDYEGNTNTTDNTKESNIPNGNASINLEEGYLTGVSQNTNDVVDTNTTDTTSTIQSTGTDTTNSTTTSTGTEDINSSTTSTGTEDNNLRESTSLLSQGNIGVTSSAHLLKEWREVLINIDEMLINECRDLFFMLY